ncbi:MAG TPA: MBOAT family O-acyltransferase [Anaerolineaceae bacterium]|nr:MBOAT family O-acyltransferase [Anaerolineaceae bacterium]
MDILSWQFAAFTVVVLAIYYLLTRRAQNVWLLLASYVFYLSMAWQYLALLLLTTVVNYFLAWRIERDVLDRPRPAVGEAATGGARSLRSRSSPFLSVGLLWNVAALVLFHLASSTYGQSIFGSDLHLALNPHSIWTRFLFPVGFSFYSLQAISYLVDVSRRQVPASRDALDFALYMAYFPKLTAGPIERARGFLPALARPRRVDNQAVTRGLALIVTGLVRKLVIAQTLQQMISTDLFKSPLSYGGLQLWGGILAYSFILYNDFAGYTSIMRGVSALFGLELNQNFNQPYFSRSFSEFWTRWHISLSNWLRDYIFFPVSRTLLRRQPNPRHPLNLVVPPLTTMLVSSLWHGFSLGMVTWGGLHGLYQALERLVQGSRPRQSQNRRPALQQVSSALLTFLLAMLAWVPFATNDFSLALQYWKGMVLLGPGVNAFRMPFGWIFAAIGLSLAIDWAQYHTADDVVFLKWVRPAQAFLLALAVLLVLASLGQAVDVSGFVYQGF